MEYSPTKLNALLHAREDAPLSPTEIASLEDGSIVCVQWPQEENILPYKIRTRQYEDCDRPWIYATDIRYTESPCLYHREISGFGLHKPGTTLLDLRVWRQPTFVEPEHEEGDEVFATMIWA